MNDERIGHFLKVRHINGAPHPCWRVFNNAGETLGLIEYFPRWREYTFDPSPAATFSTVCLRDLAAFLARCNKAAKEART